MTTTVKLSQEDLCRPSFYPENTLVIKTWGPGAARATHLMVQRHLGALSGAPPATLQVWRLEDPYRWYVVGPPSLHGKTGQIPDPLCFFRIEQLGKETTRATLHWLPPTLKYEGLKKIVNMAVGGGHFEKVPHRVDQAAVYVPKEREKDIPHYVELKFEEQTLFLLVTVPGRRTECRHCGDTDHWSNRCSRTAPPRNTTYAEKTKRAPPPPKSTKPASTPKQTTKTDNEADVETDDETSTWTVVGPRKKRRRQGPTPRTSPAVEDSFLGTTGEEDNNGGDNNSDNNNNAQQGNDNRNGGNNDNEHNNTIYHSDDEEGNDDEEKDTQTPQTRKEDTDRD